MVDGKDRLDEAGGTGRGHRVADHRLDRTDRQLVAVTPEEPVERLDLGGVPGRRCCAMGLHHAERGRIAPRPRPGTFEGKQLAGHARPHQASTTPVGRDPDAADGRIRAQAGTLGRLGTHEDDDTNTLADEQAVGPAVEGTHDARRAQCLELREDAPQRHVMAEMDAPGDDRVAAAPFDLAHRRVDRNEGARARGVDRVGGSVEVEAVGNARRREVRDEVDGRLGTIRTKPSDECFPDPLDLVLTHARHEVPERGDELAQGAHALVEARDSGRQVPTTPQDDADARAIPDRVGATGIRQGHRRGLESEKLVRLGLADGHGHDPEGGGVEGGDVVDEAAAVAVEAVGLPLRVRVEVDGVPPGRGHRRDGIDTGHEIAPVGVEVGCAGEDTSHADDDDAVACVTALRGGARRPARRR